MRMAGSGWGMERIYARKGDEGGSSFGWDRWGIDMLGELLMKSTSTSAGEILSERVSSVYSTPEG